MQSCAVLIRGRGGLGIMATREEGVQNLFLLGKWSGRWDLNPRPLGPEPSALPSYATPRPTEDHQHAAAGPGLQIVSTKKFAKPVSTRRAGSSAALCGSIRAA